jgi:type I restriction enzyme S subunit
MNQIEKLIEEFCPEGVHFVELDELAQVSTGKAPVENWKSANGSFPFINGGTSPSGYVHDSNTAGNAIAIPSRGSVGRVAYLEAPFWCGPLSYRIRSQNEASVMTKYLFYFL